VPAACSLFILVEGPDDERFCKRILREHLRPKWRLNQVVPYAHENAEFVSRLVDAIKSGTGSDYVLMADRRPEPCVTAKRSALLKRFRAIHQDRIIVVGIEIEAWYLAGLNKKNSAKLGVQNYASTDNVTKEEFNAAIPRRFSSSRADWLLEILRIYSVQTAIGKNRSFAYFADKYLA